MIDKKEPLQRLHFDQNNTHVVFWNTNVELNHAPVSDGLHIGLNIVCRQPNNEAAADYCKRHNEHFQKVKNKQ